MFIIIRVRLFRLLSVCCYVHVIAISVLLRVILCYFSFMSFQLYELCFMMFCLLGRRVRLLTASGRDRDKLGCGFVSAYLVSAVYV